MKRNEFLNELDDAAGLYMLMADMFICISFVLFLIVGNGHPAVLDLVPDVQSGKANSQSEQVLYLSAKNGTLLIRRDNDQGAVVQLDNIGKELDPNQPLIFVHGPELPVAYVYEIQAAIHNSPFTARFGLSSIAKKEAQ